MAIPTLSMFTKVLVTTGGLAMEDDLAAFSDAGYSEWDVLGIGTGIAIMAIFNYSNHHTQPELDEVFSGRPWRINKQEFNL